MTRWGPVFDRECHDLVLAVCGTRRDPDRTRAWHALITRVGPFIEEWARTSSLLRRCRLDSEDETRSILVAVLERMRQHDFQNLQSYLARQTPEMAADCEAAAVAELARAARLCDDDDADDDDDARATPLRGWLLQLTHYAVREHVRRRLGWGQTAHATFGVEPVRKNERGRDLAAALRQIDGIAAATYDDASAAITVEYFSGSVRRDAVARAITQAGWTVVREPDAPATKRDVGTDAPRLDDVAEPGTRPPITDLVAVRRLVAEVQAYMSTFPGPMREALELWLQDHGFAEISTKLALADAAQARAMVRAGQARLRDRFRGHWPALFGAAA